MTETTYISCADTAKLVRKALKREFAGVTFSVRSQTYAGGASINVRWTDGPRSADVDPILKRYEGGRFDGMIDMAYSVTHYLRSDGEVMVATDPGTVGQRGSHAGEDNSALADIMPADVERVRFGADHIFGQRHVSDFDSKKQVAIVWIYTNCQIDDPTGNPNQDRFGNDWVEDIAVGIVRNWTGDTENDFNVTRYRM
jgi:hypothetical protein